MAKRKKQSKVQSEENCQKERQLAAVRPARQPRLRSERLPGRSRNTRQ
jgi:hypothetical protein